MASSGANVQVYTAALCDTLSLEPMTSPIVQGDRPIADARMDGMGTISQVPSQVILMPRGVLSYP